jgi:hypothetical protein
MAGNWNEAVKDIRKLGIRVKTSINSCCPGCVDSEAEKISPDEPMIFSLRTRFNGTDGGVLYHQKIGGTPLAGSVAEILYKHGVVNLWDQTEDHTIIVNLDN